MLGIGLAQHLVRRPRNSPLRFGADVLGQQEDMWLRLRLRPNPDYRRDFTYSQNVRRDGYETCTSEVQVSASGRN